MRMRWSPTIWRSAERRARVLRGGSHRPSDRSADLTSQVIARRARPAYKVGIRSAAPPAMHYVVPAVLLIVALIHALPLLGVALAGVLGALSR